VGYVWLEVEERPRIAALAELAAMVLQPLEETEVLELHIQFQEHLDITVAAEGVELMQEEQPERAVWEGVEMAQPGVEVVKMALQILVVEVVPEGRKQMEYYQTEVAVSSSSVIRPVSNSQVARSSHRSS
jgi:hypothetical protein